MDAQDVQFEEKLDRTRRRNERQPLDSQHQRLTIKDCKRAQARLPLGGARWTPW